MKVALTGPAQRQLFSIAMRIREHAPNTADAFVETALAQFQTYSRRPFAFRIIMTRRGLDIRKGHHPTHRQYESFYTVRDGQFVVLALVHGRMSEQTKVVGMDSGLDELSRRSESGGPGP